MGVPKGPLFGVIGHGLINQLPSDRSEWLLTAGYGATRPTDINWSELNGAQGNFEHSHSILRMTKSVSFVAFSFSSFSFSNSNASNP